MTTTTTELIMNDPRIGCPATREMQFPPGTVLLKEGVRWTLTEGRSWVSDRPTIGATLFESSGACTVLSIPLDPRVGATTDETSVHNLPDGTVVRYLPGESRGYVMTKRDGHWSRPSGEATYPASMNSNVIIHIPFVGLDILVGQYLYGEVTAASLPFGSIIKDVVSDEFLIHCTSGDWCVYPVPHGSAPFDAGVGEVRVLRPEPEYVVTHVAPTGLRVGALVPDRSAMNSLPVGTVLVADRGPLGRVRERVVEEYRLLNDATGVARNFSGASPRMYNYQIESLPEPVATGEPRTEALRFEGVDTSARFVGMEATPDQVVMRALSAAEVYQRLNPGYSSSGQLERFIQHACASLDIPFRPELPLQIGQVVNGLHILPDGTIVSRHSVGQAESQGLYMFRDGVCGRVSGPSHSLTQREMAVVRHVPDDILVYPAWVSEEPTRELAEKAMELVDLLDTGGRERKMEKGWCTEYEFGMESVGFPGQRISQDSRIQRTFLPGTLMLYSTPCGTALFKRSDESTNPAGTVRVGGGEGHWVERAFPISVRDILPARAVTALTAVAPEGAVIRNSGRFFTLNANRQWVSESGEMVEWDRCSSDVYRFVSIPDA